MAVNDDVTRKAKIDGLALKALGLMFRNALTFKLRLKGSFADGQAQANIPDVGTTDPANLSDGDIWSRSGTLWRRVAGATYRFWDSSNLGSVSQADAEAGTDTTNRIWSALRVAQGITAQAVNTRVSVISAGTYTMQASDQGKTLHFTHASPTITLPNNLPDTFNFLWRTWGGQATFAAASGGTLHHPDNHTKSAKAKASGGCEVVANGTGTAADWLLSGYTST